MKKTKIRILSVAKVVTLTFIVVWFFMTIYTYHAIGSSNNNNNNNNNNSMIHIDKVMQNNNNNNMRIINNNNKDEETLNKNNNMNHAEQQQQQQQQQKVVAVASNQQQQQQQQHEQHSDESLWYGWQPNIPSNPDCSWRQCFKEKHGCKTTCRDEDLDEAPQPIKPVPPKDATKDDYDKYWIPDVTMLRRMYIDGKDANGNVWPPPLPNELCESIGTFGGPHDDNKILLDAVPIKVVEEEEEEDSKQPTILCMMYTMDDAHSTRIRAIRETWASHCDGFLAFSTKSDPRIPAISIEHDGIESYTNMWQKVRSIWKFVGIYYNKQFDYYMLGGDDLFVIPENVRHYLQINHNNPIRNHYFIGRRFHGYEKFNFFNSGGAGYILSQATLNSFISIIDHPKCSPKRTTSMEDVMIAQCLRDVLNITFVDTRDEYGRERFHPFSPGSHHHWKPPKKGNKDWYEDYNRDWGIKLGIDCCAPDSVSFHYIKKPATIRHMYSLLYTCN